MDFYVKKNVTYFSPVSGSTLRRIILSLIESSGIFKKNTLQTVKLQ